MSSKMKFDNMIFDYLLFIFLVGGFPPVKRRNNITALEQTQIPSEFLEPLKALTDAMNASASMQLQKLSQMRFLMPRIFTVRD